MKNITVVILLVLSATALSAQTIQKLHFKKGSLLGYTSDTLYARVLPNEVLFADCRVRGLKKGVSFKILTMDNKVIYENERLKRERLRIPLAQGQDVVKVVVNNATTQVGKYVLQVDRVIGDSAPTEIDQTIYWMDVIDTTFKWVEVPYYIYGDSSSIQLLDETRKVHSVTSVYDNEDCVSFKLPEHTIKWSYYIGVDQRGSEAYELAIKDMAGMVKRMVAGPLAISPLAGLMAYGIQTIAVFQRGEDIDCAVVDPSNALRFKNDEPYKSVLEGRFINGSRIFNEPLSGEWNICLENDNLAEGVSVRVVIEALVRPTTKQLKKEKIVDTIVTRKAWFVR